MSHIPVVNHALVLAPEYGFSDNDDSKGVLVSPTHKLLGVPVIVRCLRQLQDSGVSHSIVVVPEKWSYAEEVVKKDFRITHDVEFSYVKKDEKETDNIKTLAKSLSGPFFICRSDLVAPAALFTDMVNNPPENGFMFASKFSNVANEEMGLRIKDGFELVDGSDTPLALPGAMLIGGNSIDELRESGDWKSTFAEAATRSEVDIQPVGEYWSQTVRTSDDLFPAEAKLLNGLRKPIDGFIAKTINRDVSIPMSRVLANTFITPNMASAFTLVLALIAAYIVSHGGYWCLFIGAFIFQMASIIDGVDGEIARLKYQFSKAGEWFDTIIDDISNFLFFASLTYAIYYNNAGPEWLAPLGLLTLCCYSLITPLMYTYIIKYTDSGDVMAIDFDFNKLDSFQDPRFSVRIMAFLKHIVKRDFFIFMIFVCAMFGRLPYLLVPVSVGAVSILITVLVQHKRKLSEK